jgi:hypothetical protein
MSDYRQGPDSTTLKLAKAILDRETNGTPFTVDVIEAARKTADWGLAVRNQNEAIYKAEQEKQAKIDALLDADLPAGGPCQHTVYYSNRDYRGHACGRTSTKVRHWTTTEFDHFELDGKTLLNADGTMAHYAGEVRIPDGWEIGKGFTEREPTTDEWGRIVRIMRTDQHSAILCGTHRKMKGQYGMPY